MKQGAGRRFRSFGIILLAMSLAALTACSNSKPADISASGYVDIGQSDVSTARVDPVDGPQKLKVVALANGSAEIIAAMGLRNYLVGRDVASTESALETVPIVTSGHQVIPEKIISLHPDVVLVDAATGPASALDVLRKSGVTLIEIPEAWTLKDISVKVKSIGQAIGAQKTALQLNTKMQAEISKAQTPAKVKLRIAFLYLRGTSSIYLMGGPGSGADSLIGAIGAVDVGAASLPHPFNSLTSEALVKANPDILLVMTKGLDSVGGIDGLISLPGVAQTNAGKAKRVISVDDSLLLSFGPRTPSLISKLSNAVSRVMK